VYLLRLTSRCVCTLYGCVLLSCWKSDVSCSATLALPGGACWLCRVVPAVRCPKLSAAAPSLFISPVPLLL
jgi:hypothetical protein